MGVLSKLIFGPPDAEKIGKEIIWNISKYSFCIFKNEKVRESINFETLEQIEQDRIFNEFIINGIVLGYLILEDAKRIAAPEHRSFLHELAEIIFYGYRTILKDMGAEHEHADLFKEVIRMRYDEYHDEWEESRSELPDKAKELGFIPWDRVVAIGALHHIRRGKTSPEDPFFKILLDWTMKLSEEIQENTLRAVKRI